MLRVVLIVFGLGAVTAGMVVVRAELVAPWLEARDARDWSETTCEIAKSNVKTTYATRVSATESRTHGRRMTTVLDAHDEARIVYFYEVDGESHVGHRASFRTANAESPGTTVGRYPQGGTVPCYFDPEEPAQAVLDRSFGTSWWWSILGGLFLLVGIAALVKSRRVTHRKLAKARQV